MFRQNIAQPERKMNNSYMFMLICAAAVTLYLYCGAAYAQYKSFEIADYQYAQFSSSDEASIDLYGLHGDLLGILIFLPVDQTSQLPQASQGSDGIIRFYYKRERLYHVIDQLRSEAPLELNYWVGAGGNNSHIRTLDREPVGEAE